MSNRYLHQLFLLTICLAGFPSASSRRSLGSTNNAIYVGLNGAASSVRKSVFDNLTLKNPAPTMISSSRRASTSEVNSATTINVRANKTPSPPIKTKPKIPLSSLPPPSAYTRPLLFWENMVCGAISRSVAQTIMHPANTMKTILQSRSHEGEARATLQTLCKPSNVKLLTRGAGAQLLLSLPHGAVNFAVLEYVRRHLNQFVERRYYANDANSKEDLNGKVLVGPGLDFVSSALSTLCCSVVSTPQMMITDNIMAGTYPNLVGAVKGLASKGGIGGFYTGWWPGLAGKIPSYGMTWMLFQQLKESQLRIMNRPPKDIENSIMGCIASATTVCIMIPMDTIKTRLVTQANFPELTPYKGIINCAVRVSKDEGFSTFYRGLAPRLISVVPMIGIQFGVYEFMKKVMLAKNAELKDSYVSNGGREYDSNKLQEILMEVAADDEQPFPVPHFTTKPKEEKKKKKKLFRR